MNQLKSLHNQKGDMLLEALISMVLMGIVAMGITYALSKVAVNQRETKEHIVVVNDLRQILLTTPRSELCKDGATKPTTVIAGKQVDITPVNCDKTIKLTVKLENESGYTEIKTLDAPIGLSVGDYLVGSQAITVSEPVGDVAEGQ